MRYKAKFKRDFRRVNKSERFLMSPLTLKERMSRQPQLVLFLITSIVKLKTLRGKLNDYKS